MKKSFIAALLLGLGVSLSAASTCNVKKTEIEWKAFKTPLKVGVKGTFDDVKLTYDTEAATKEKLLQSASALIKTASINSKNKARDAKLVAQFFEVQNIKEIQAKVVNFNGKIATVAITMNGKTLNVPMKVELDDDEIELEGVIDLGDFAMLPALKSINKACYALHKGKTWQDVELEMEIKVPKSCK